MFSSENQENHQNHQEHQEHQEQFWSFLVPGLHKRQTLLFTFIFLSNSSIHNMFRHSALITWYLILDWQQKWWITKNCTPNFHFLQQLTGKSESWAKMGLKTSTPQGCPLFLGCRSLSSFVLKLHLAEFRNSSISHIFSQWEGLARPPPSGEGSPSCHVAHTWTEATWRKDTSDLI